MFYQEKLQDQSNASEHEFSCFVYSSNGPEYPLHCHTHIEIIYVLRNKLVLTINGNQQVCNKGDMVFIPTLVPHSIGYINNDISIHMVLQVSLNFFDNNKDTAVHKIFNIGNKVQHQIIYNISSNEEVSKIFHELQHLCKFDYQDNILPNQEYTFDSDIPSELWRAKGLIFILFSFLIEQDFIEISENENDFNHIQDLSRMQSVLSYMINHPEQKISLEDAASMAYMSYYNFSRTFKRVMKYSFTDYQNLIRIQYAEELLLETNKSITEIANLLNYSTIGNFNRTFKKYNGISPSDFRKRCRAKYDKKKAN